MDTGGQEYARSVFLSYHKGNRPIAELLIRELREQLRAPLEERLLNSADPRQPEIEVWYDDELMGGDKWDARIQLKLEQADVILFLVTEASLAATYMWAEELPVAVRRMAHGARIVALTYNHAAAPILTQFETKNCQRLPEATVDRLGEAAWMSQVAKGVRKIIRNSLLQVNPTPTRRRASAIAASQNAIAECYAVLPRGEGNEIGGIPVGELTRALDMCALVLGLNDPREQGRSLDPCRERLAALRVKLAAAASDISERIRDIVHELEAVQTWINEEQAEPILQRLSVSPSALSLDAAADLEGLGSEISTIQSAVAALGEAPPSGTDIEQAAREIAVDQIARHASISKNLLEEGVPDIGAVAGQISAIEVERTAFQSVIRHLGETASVHSVRASGTIQVHTDRAHQWTARLVARAGGKEVPESPRDPPEAEQTSADDGLDVGLDADTTPDWSARVEWLPEPTFPTKSGMFSSEVLALELNADVSRMSSTKRGRLFEEPSVVAYVTEGGRKVVHAVGAEAKNMLGKTHKMMEVIRPLRDGVIADFDVAEEMIKQLIRKAMGSSATIGDILVSVPSGSTPVERRAIVESAQAAGARDVKLIEEVVAAAVGAGLQIDNPSGCMVVDIGGGTTEIAVLSLGGVVWSRSLRVAGYKMDEAIIQHLRRSENLLIGDASAELIIKAVGTAEAPDDGQGPTLVIKGRDNVDGSPKEVPVTETMVAEALAEPVAQLVEAVKEAFDQFPPEMADPVRLNGIHLLGKSAGIRGLGQQMSIATRSKVMIHAGLSPTLVGLHMLALNKDLAKRVSAEAP